MQLLLSSAALPDGPLGELRAAVQRRSLDGLEAVLGTGHGHEIEATCEVGRSESPPPSRREEEVPVRWLIMSGEPSVAEVLYWSQRAHLLRSGLVIPGPTSISPAGLPVALLHSTDLESVKRAVDWARMHHARTCWQVKVGRPSPSAVAEALEVTGPHLSHVRLLGAGPEPQSGAPGTVGTGDVLKELALQGYSGTVALAPSEEEHQETWWRWLLDERGWGCNTAAKKRASRPGSSG